LFIVEERKADSLQLWQRKKEEVDEQKRLLKTELQNKIHVLSENLKNPSFILTRDKILFTIGVANACFSPLIGMRKYSSLKFYLFLFIAGRWPHILPIVYTIQALCLITLRFFIYKRKHWHYFGRIYIPYILIYFSI
jgi:hypothetical protein